MVEVVKDGAVDDIVVRLEDVTVAKKVCVARKLDIAAGVLKDVLVVVEALMIERWKNIW